MKLLSKMFFCIFATLLFIYGIYFLFPIIIIFAAYPPILLWFLAITILQPIGIYSLSKIWNINSLILFLLMLLIGIFYYFVGKMIPNYTWSGATTIGGYIGSISGMAILCNIIFLIYKKLYCNCTKKFTELFKQIDYKKFLILVISIVIFSSIQFLFAILKLYSWFNLGTLVLLVFLFLIPLLLSIGCIYTPKNKKN